MPRKQEPDNSPAQYIRRIEDVSERLEALRSQSWEVAAKAAESLRNAPGERVTRALAEALDAHDTAITEAATDSLIVRNEPGTADLMWQALTTLDEDVTDEMWSVIRWRSDHPISQELQRRYKAQDAAEPD